MFNPSYICFSENKSNNRLFVYSLIKLLLLLNGSHRSKLMMEKMVCRKKVQVVRKGKVVTDIAVYINKAQGWVLFCFVFFCQFSRQTQRQISLLSSSGMSYTILSIPTMSTTSQRTKTTTVSQPVKMQNASKVIVAGTDTTLRHKAMHLIAMTSTAKIAGYPRHWSIVQTLNLLSHPVMTLQVDCPPAGSAAQKCFLLPLEFMGQMRRTFQFQNTGER